MTKYIIIFDGENERGNQYKTLATIATLARITGCWSQRNPSNAVN